METLTHNQFDTLKNCLRQINRYIATHQFAMVESLKNGTEYWFTTSNIEELNQLRQTVKAADSEYLTETNFRAEIKHNLAIIQEEQQLKEYIYELSTYVSDVKRCMEKVNSFLWTINDLYVLTDIDEGVEIVSGNYTNLTTPYRLAAGIHMAMVNVTTFGLDYTTSTVFENVESIRDTYFPKPTQPIITSANNEPDPTEPGVKLQWREKRGDKTDLAELIYALAKSGRITDTTTNKPVTIDVLANQIGPLLGVTIKNPMQLMQGRKDSYKAAEDGLTFSAALSELVDRYIADQ